MNADALILQVGFVLKENIGYTRSFDYEIPELVFADNHAVSNFELVMSAIRTPQGLHLEGEVSSDFEASCSRCLRSLPTRVVGPLSETFHYPAKDEEEFIITEGGEMDMGPLVRELLVVSEPSYVLCETDCKGLCPTCGINRNNETCDCESDNIDPRLAILKTLLDN